MASTEHGISCTTATKKVHGKTVHWARSRRSPSSRPGPGVLTATGLWVDRSDPALSFVNPRNQGILPMRIFHTTSTDGGRTWSPRRRMDVRPHRGASPATEAVITLPNGVLAQPYETWKDYHDDGLPDQGAYLRLSHDGAKTWPRFATMARHPSGGKYYWDVRIARHPETGRHVGTYWDA